MKASEAVKLINECTFHPDWKIVASDDWWVGGGNKIDVQFRCATWDSSEVWPDGSYHRRIGIGPSVTIDVTDLDEETLLYTVLDCKSQVQQHEDREFLRVKTGRRWVAPFHPHNADGRILWDHARGIARRVTVPGAA